MKRNMEIIRLVLMEQEIGQASAELSEFSDDEVMYNMVLMKDAGLVEASIIEDGSGDIARVTIIRMTWAGHDFLDAARDDTIWKKAKARFFKPTASWTFSLLVEWLKAEAKAKLLGHASIGDFPTGDTTA
jgi:hypothetical protein